MDLQETTKNDKNDKPTLSKRNYKETAVRMRMFLKAYAECGRVGEACETVEVSRDLHYQWLEKHADYRDAFEQTKYRVGQLIEDKVIELAMNGEVSLLLPVLRRFRPEYRERITADVALTVNLAERLTNARQRLIQLRQNNSAA